MQSALVKQTFIDRPDFKWIDIQNPSKAELQAIAREYGLPESTVRDCLDPRHLPKQEKCGAIDFLITRVFDPMGKDRDVSVQNLTRKIAIFFAPQFVITVHRAELSLVNQMKLEAATNQLLGQDLVVMFLKGVATSFDAPMAESEDQLDRFEELLFKREATFKDLQGLHALRRKISLMKRLQLHHAAVFQRTQFISSPAVVDLKETLDHAIFFIDELLEDVTSLLNLQLAVSTHRTSEVVRILTVFSVFFLPLTFIVGIYGMNFEFMPEIKWPYGYAFSWGVMIFVTLAIALWFKRRGWLNF